MQEGKRAFTLISGLLHASWPAHYKLFVLEDQLMCLERDSSIPMEQYSVICTSVRCKFLQVVDMQVCIHQGYEMRGLSWTPPGIMQSYRGFLLFAKKVEAAARVA
jgi:hypothetical protein